MYFKEELNNEGITLNHLNKLKDTVEHYGNIERYDRIKSYIIEFDTEYHLAAACFNIERDSHGNFLSKDIPMSLTVFPQNGKTYNIISVLTKQSLYFDERLLDYSEESKKIMLSYNITCSSDNFAFSPRVWESYSDRIKNEFLALNKSKSIPKFVDCQNGMNLFIHYN